MIENMVGTGRHIYEKGMSKRENLGEGKSSMQREMRKLEG